MFDGFERANTLLAYITVYRKGKSIDDLTINHMMFWEDEKQFPHDISVALNDDTKKSSTAQQQRFRLSSYINIDAHVTVIHSVCYRKRPSLYGLVCNNTRRHYVTAHMWHETGVVLYASSSNVVVSFKSKPPPPRLTHLPLADGYAFTFHSNDQRCLTKYLRIII